MSSCFPRAELPHNGTISKQTQPTMIKRDIRSALSGSRAPGAAFPFLGEGQSFAPKIHDLASALYGLPYGSSSFYHGLPSPGIDVAALYNSMNRSDLKEFPAAWRGPPPPFHHYDPTLASLVYAGGLSHLALADGTRRKNATRETTSVLKEWLDNHKKNPYPTKAEKIMLAVESKMSLTQVSTWFANARRRLKKENKMTWSPRNCTGEERDSGDDNIDQNFPISPRDHEDGLNQTKSNSTPIQLARLSDSKRSAATDIVYQQQLQQQMIWRQLSLLPPAVRTTEMFKHIQEQMQLRSRWAATAASEQQPRSTDPSRTFASSAKISPNFDSKLLQERRNSVGSPSTSSYDRSPSPFQRSSQSTWTRPVVLEQPKALRKSSSNSDTHTEITSQMEESNEDEKQRTKSSDENGKTKPSIWSPASMLNDKNSESKLENTNDICKKSFAFSATTTEQISKANLNLNTLTTSGSTDYSMMFQGKSKLPSLDAVNQSLQATLAAQAYLRECQRQIATHQSFQNQHGLPSVMLPMSIDKNQSILRDHLFEQLQRNPNIQSKHLFSNGETNDLGLSAAQSQNAEEDDAVTDTPMNLSKNIKLREAASSLRPLRSDFETKSEPWPEAISAATV